MLLKFIHSINEDRDKSIQLYDETYTHKKYKWNYIIIDINLFNIMLSVEKWDENVIRQRYFYKEV